MLLVQEMLSTTLMGLTMSSRFFMWTAVGEVLPDESINSARSPSLALALHVSFVVISTVVLMSLLIGMMSMTYATDTNAGRRIWCIHERTCSDSC